MVEVASLVVFAADLDKTAAFYRAVGLDLELEDHGSGPVHFAAEVDSVHFAVYPADSAGRAPARRAAGGSFPGFYVESLDDTTTALVDLGTPFLQQHQDMPWGCRVVVTDPDGRPVEVNQRGHCSPAP
jgi:predicted enzyme related to lactoylglutathione lyase